MVGKEMGLEGHGNKVSTVFSLNLLPMGDFDQANIFFRFFYSLFILYKPSHHTGRHFRFSSEKSNL